jgi:hypothetical protein
MEKRRVLAWSVQAVLITKTIRIIKPGKPQKHFASGLFHSSESEGKIIVYRGYFLRLLSIAKPLRDQLIIELPTLQGFRTGEIGTVEMKHIDFEHGDIQVLDSKKYRLSTLPLDATIADHLDKYIHVRGIVSGPLFKPEKRTRPRKPNSKTKGVGLSLSYIQRVWRKWCDICGIPYMSPRYGRAYFAANWVFVEHKNIYHLMAMLRHNDILATQKYLAKIVDYDDLKTEFYRGKKSPFLSPCTRFDACPSAADGCYCRWFQPKIEVHLKHE